MKYYHQLLKTTLFCFLALLFFSSSIVKSNSAELFFEYTGISKNQIVSKIDFLNNKPSQLTKTDNSEHLNCQRNLGEAFFFYVSKTPKTYSASEARIADALDYKRFSSFRKTTHELGLSYEFARLNILSSKSHPPTLPLFFI